MVMFMIMICHKSFFRKTKKISETGKKCFTFKETIIEPPVRIAGKCI